jgi:hypothetical protein
MRIATSLVGVLCAASVVSCLDQATLALMNIDMSKLATKVRGQLATRSAAGEVQTASFTDCGSGEPQGFFGVDLVAPGVPEVLRVTQDPIVGTRALLLRPGGSTTFTRAGCQVLDSSVAKSGASMNHVALLEGHVNLACQDENGASYSGNVTFSGCRGSETAAQAVASLQGASALPPAVEVPPHTGRVSLPPALAQLTVRPRAVVVGGAHDAASQAKAAAGCDAVERRLLGHLGLRVVDDESADVEAEMACSGEVTLLEAPTSVTLVFPRPAPPTLTFRSGGQVIETVPTGPPALRCEAPASPERTSRCATSADEWSTARVARALAESPRLVELARRKHP